MHINNTKEITSSLWKEKDDVGIGTELIIGTFAVISLIFFVLLCCFCVNKLYEDKLELRRSIRQREDVLARLEHYNIVLVENRQSEV